jgi:hypothetical protein
MVQLEATLDVYSGMPNPSWVMPEDKVKEFLEIKGWKELMNPEDHGVSLDLGYRGFIVSVRSEQDEKVNLSSVDIPARKPSKLPSTFRIYGSKRLVGDNSFKHSLSLEEIQEKEKWLLKTSGDLSAELSKPGLRQYVEQSISSGGHPTSDKSENQQQEVREPSTEALGS